MQSSFKAHASVSKETLLVSLVMFLYPVLTILFYLIPMEFLGKNFWIVIPVLVMATLYSRTFFRLRGFLVFHERDITLLMLAIFGFLIFGIRDIVFSENRSSLDFYYVLTPILFLLVFRRSVIGQNNLRFVSQVVIVTCLLQAVVGIVHTHFFSNIQVSYATREIVTAAERPREGGTLGVSIYANFIVAGMFLVVFSGRKSWPFNSVLFSSISVLVMLYAITLSGSRYPIIWALLLAAIFLSRGLTDRKQVGTVFALFAAIVLFAFVYGKSVELHSIWRFYEDSGGRLVKLVLALSLLSESPLHLLIGASSASAGNAVSSEGIGISDNSYLLMALQFGAYFMVAWYAWFIALLKRNVRDMPSLLFMIYVVVGLGITNSILWVQWVFVAMLVSAILPSRVLLQSRA